MDKSPVPTNYRLSERIAHYMCARFCFLAWPGSENPKLSIPIDLPVHGIVAMHQLVQKLVQAYKEQGMLISIGQTFGLIFPVITDCDLQAVSAELRPQENGLDDTREEELERKYPSGLRSAGKDDKVIFKPTVILRKDGTIALWYLPGALTTVMQVWSL